MTAIQIRAIKMAETKTPQEAKEDLKDYSEELQEAIVAAIVDYVAWK